MGRHRQKSTNLPVCNMLHLRAQSAPCVREIGQDKGNCNSDSDCNGSLEDTVLVSLVSRHAEIEEEKSKSLTRAIAMEKVRESHRDH